MRTPCCHTFLAFVLKFLNFLQAFVGVVIIVYSAYVLSKWNHNHLSPPPNPSVTRLPADVVDALRFNFYSLPAPWFAYASMGIGILVCCISFIGHVGTEAMSGCCLCFYAILSTIFVLLEVGLVAFISLDHHWQKGIPSDPTGELDSLWTFIQENIDVFEWIGILIFIIQVLSLLFAVILRSLVSSQKEDDDIEVDYGYNSRNREPLLTSYSSQASALTRGDSDIWSSRMREKDCPIISLTLTIGPTYRMTTRAEERISALERGMVTLDASVTEIRASVASGFEEMRAMLRALSTGKDTLAEGSTSAAEDNPFAHPHIANQTAPPPIVQRSAPPISMQPPRLELPNFNGENPSAWISRADQFFRVENTPEDMKLEYALIAMEGSALHWLQWLMGRIPTLSWRRFTIELLKRYGDDPRANPCEALASTRQTGSVDDYVDTFISRMAGVPSLSDANALGLFLHGLREDIRVRIRSKDAEDICTTMHLAREIEREIATTKPPFFSRPAPTPNRTNSGFRPPQQQQYSRSSGVLAPRNPTSGFQRASELPRSSGPNTQGLPYSDSSANSVNQVSRPPRQMSQSEYRDLRSKGLCFRCREPYSPTHTCGNRSLRVMVVLDEDEELDPGESTGPQDPENVEDITLQSLQLSAATAFGFDGPTTMKLLGKIGDTEVVAMVDSGATHCFISQKTVASLNLPIDDSVTLPVKLGDGKDISTVGRCPCISLQFGTVRFNFSAYVFPISGVDIILGVTFLAALGDIRVNWATQTLKFTFHDQQFCLQGDPGLEKRQISAATSLKLAEIESCWILWQPELYQLEGNQTTVLAPEIQQVLDEYSQVLSPLPGLPPSRDCDHRIPLQPGAAPVSVRPYRYSAAQKTEIERLIEEMLSAGLIQPSTGPYSSPVLLVHKKDGSWRFCVDYRELNKRTVPDKYPIPVIQELLDELHGASWFTRLDLRAGYHQIRVAPEDIPKTGFRTHSGHYEFVVMPFGLRNAPSTFQAVMNDLFRPLLRRYVLVFFDDILIYSSDWQSHIDHLREVLRILAAASFVVNPKKCSWAQSSIEYLGHVVSAEGVQMDPSKVLAVLQWPTPKSVKGVRGFLGLTGYYRRFIKDYGKIAWPLTTLLRKESDSRFSWGSEAQAAFEALQKAITSAPVLAVPDFSAPFLIECDASGRGLGAVLMQDKRPIAYFSKALSDRNVSKSTYEKELMALVLAVLHWRPYLLGRKFIVRTDHHSLKHLLQQSITSPAQQYWVSKLIGFDFEIEYKTGITNVAADALSRRDSDIACEAISVPQWMEWSALKRAVRSDPLYASVIQALEKGETVGRPFVLVNGILYFKDRLVIPLTSGWVPRLLSEFHSTPTGGHAGAYRTYRRLAANVYWPGMMKVVTRFVAECLVCQRNKSDSRSPAGLLQPLPIPERVWEDVSMDFITGLPRSQNLDVILVVVDRLSKATHFIGLLHPFTARGVALAFAREVVRLHGVPRSIVSDRDPVFLSAFWQELFKATGTQLRMSSSYHPETDGQSEVMNRCLETYLRCFVSTHPKHWAQWLSWAEYCFNTSFHSATGCTPFEAVYGRKPPVLSQFLPGEIRVKAVLDDLLERDEILQQLRIHLERAQQRMTRESNKHRRDVVYEVGDRVFLKFRPYRQLSLFKKLNVKLAPRYFGPFVISHRIGQAAYRLVLPEGCRLHPVFHVSQLKASIGDHVADSNLPPDIADEAALFMPSQVLRARQIWRGDQRVSQLLVAWADRPEEEAAWVDEELFRAQFPEFSLEGKAVLEREGIVTYKRRARKE